MAAVTDIRSALRREDGFTVAELLVSVSILMTVLGMVYFALEAVNVSAQVSERQSLFAAEIANPMHGMDKVLSANTAIENAGSFVSNGYTLTTRTTVVHGTNSFQRYVYSANSDGTLTESVYRQVLGSLTPTLLRTRVWSQNNANRAKSDPMFVYYAADGTETSPSDAKSVLIKIWIKTDESEFSGQRRIFFRNR